MMPARTGFTVVTAVWMLITLMRMYFLGIDSNDQCTTAVALDLEQATVVAEGRAEHSLIEGLPQGNREQDPAGWISALDEAVQQCLLGLGPARERVAGLGVSAQNAGVVALDAENRILRAAKLAGDTSMFRHCEKLSEIFGGPPGLIELTGNKLSPQSAATFLSWLKKHESHHFDNMASAMMPHDFLNYWLTGQKRMEFSGASASGFLDVASRSWATPIIEHVDPRLAEVLPPLSSSQAPQGFLRGELVSSWGLPKEVLVSAGGGKMMMDAIGAGNVTAGGVTVRLGREGRVSGVSSKPFVDPKGEVGCVCDCTDQWMPYVMTPNATDPLEMVSRNFGWSLSELEQAVSAARCGAAGVVFLPFEETDNYGDTVRMLHGITRRNYSPVNVARAAAEGVALDFGYSLARIGELGFIPEEIHISGDWAKSSVWRQLVSNVLGLPVEAVRWGDGAALGAALQAAVTFFSENGENLSYQEIAAYAAEPAEGTRCEPNLAHHQRYRELLARRQFLSESLQMLAVGEY